MVHGTEIHHWYPDNFNEVGRFNDYIYMTLNILTPHKVKLKHCCVPSVYMIRKHNKIAFLKQYLERERRDKDRSLNPLNNSWLMEMFSHKF